MAKIEGWRLAHLDISPVERQMPSNLILWEVSCSSYWDYILAEPCATPGPFSFFTVPDRDVRAENDGLMLQEAFFESADYKTLIESDSKSIVVGRRGVGKSALFLRLGKYFEGSERTEILEISPDEHEVLALRSVSDLFGGEFQLIRAATRLGFRYALLMEAISLVSRNFKFKQAPESAYLLGRLQEWKAQGTVIQKLRHLLIRAVGEEKSPEARVGAIAECLRLNDLETNFRGLLEGLRRRFVVLIDRLDEGYKPDQAGIGIVDGFIHAAIDLRDKLPGCRSLVFLRDNIYRAVINRDEDFSRNIEQAGQTQFSSATPQPCRVLRWENSTGI